MDLKLEAPTVETPSPETPGKKVYHAPELVDYGDIREVTEATFEGSTNDGDFFRT
jgi:hypothetical protein